MQNLHKNVNGYYESNLFSLHGLIIFMTSLHSAAYREMIALLKKKRRELKWTQVELAERSGAYQSYISRVESCEQHIDIVDYFKLAHILSINDETILKTIHRHIHTLPTLSKNVFAKSKK